ncbi:MAG: protein DpdE [Nostocaceae cyanobacterium]|nr:protein DpdE [Nostocaceae cyanobacterium]
MIDLGSLVRSNTNNLGVGKVTEITDTQANLEYFCSLGKRLQKTVPLSSLSVVQLPRQTRCYIYLQGKAAWTIGRIADFDEEIGEYQINVPDSHTILASVEEIYVRCNVPISDPIELLAMKGHETPYLHDRRFGLVTDRLKQRAITSGMTGLMSANIQLFPHQVEVVRRVLTDPIQRYLLADDKGLGKTVQAGTILRQYLLDEPQGRVVVLAPQYLLEHWRTQLEEKFYISPQDNRVKILALEEANQLSTNAELGLLIIDGASQVAAMAISSDQVQRRYFTTCRNLAHRSDRLLILSAIPVLHNERDWLVMLHLLDPVTYPLDNVAGFRAQVQNRQHLGKVLLSLTADASPQEVKANLQELCQLFPEDQHLQALVEECLQTSPEASLALETNKIRTHISDSYRLYRRMLRNKSATVQEVILDRNISPKEEYDIDERTYDIHDLLEKWRTCAPKQEEYSQIFLLLFRGFSTWLGVLTALVTARLNSKSTGALVQEFGAPNVQILTKTPLFSGEAEILQSLLQILQQPSEDGDKIELLKIVLLYHFAERFGLQSFRSNTSKLLERVQLRLKRPIPGDSLPKIVIFTSFGYTCTEIMRVLQQSFGEKAIVSHQAGHSRIQIEKSFQQFKTDPNCFILLCDSSGEAGRELHFVDWMIHFDLPWSPHSLEQRIARIEGMGARANVQFTVFPGTDVDDSVQEGWYQLIKDGFGIFQESIASLQVPLEDKLPAIATTMFQSGAKGLVEMIPELGQEITDSRRQIQEQYAIDEIDISDENTSKYFQTLDDYDGRHQEMQRAVEGWLCQALQLQQRYDVNLESVMRYQPTSRTLVPVDHLKGQFAPHIEQPGTYKRRVANKNPGVKLYRTGEALMDAIASYVGWDDRGQAFAMWRTEESWDKAEGKEWFGFRFNFLVETNLEQVKQNLADYNLDKTKLKAIKRLSDNLFPPQMQTVFIDARSRPMKIVDDENLWKILQRSYNGKGSKLNRDYNLAKGRLPILDGFVDADQWQDFCTQARSLSEQLWRDRPDFQQLCEQHATLAEEQLETRIQQLHLRHKTEKIADSILAQIDTESALYSALIAGIRHPHLKLDSVGFIIVSGRPPAEGDGED